MACSKRTSERSLLGAAPATAVLVAALFAARLATASPAPTDDRDPSVDEARALFDEGRALFAAGQTARACEKLATSYAIQAKGATLLNLAVCHERLGRVATAWREFTEARALAVRDGSEERARIAEGRARQLAPRVPHLRIRFTERPPGVEARIDGAPVALAELDDAIVVDPGPHRIEIRAAAARPWRADVAATEGVTTTLTVPALPARATPEPSPGRAPATSARRTWAWISFGAAALSGGAGTAFGLRTFAQRRDAEEACAAARCGEGRAINSDAATSAWIANVTLGAAVLFGAAGAYLLLTGANPDHVALTPSGLRVRF